MKADMSLTASVTGFGAGLLASNLLLTPMWPSTPALSACIWASGRFQLCSTWDRSAGHLTRNQGYAVYCSLSPRGLSAREDERMKPRWVEETFVYPLSLAPIVLSLKCVQSVDSGSELRRKCGKLSKECYFSAKARPVHATHNVRVRV